MGRRGCKSDRICTSGRQVSVVLPKAVVKGDKKKINNNSELDDWVANGKDTNNVNTLPEQVQARVNPKGIVLSAEQEEEEDKRYANQDYQDIDYTSGSEVLFHTSIS